MIELGAHLAAVLIVGYSLTLAVVYLGLTAMASRDLRDIALTRRSEPPSDLFALPLTPPISVLVPAFNEAAGIVESVRALLGLDYPEHEVIVINDGSSDDTLKRLAEAFTLEPFDPVLQEHLATDPVRAAYRSEAHPRLLVVDKENGGKADALNVGINASRCPLVCSIDADSILESDALLKSVMPLVHRPDLTIASGGIVRIANGATFEGGSLMRTGVPRGMLARFQLVEYLRAFIVGRSGWSRLKSLLIVSGAFGVFRRDILLEVGGYRPDTVGEDVELIIRLHRHMRDQGRPYRIEFVPDPVCWTEAPETLTVLRQQRTRWQRGLYETLSIHRGMLFNPRYGRLGLVGLPYFLAFELLGPVVEFFGIGLLVFFAWQGLLHPAYALLLIGVTIGTGVLISIVALAFEEAAFHRFPHWRQSATLLVFSVLENFGYRQLTAWWRLVGLWQSIRGRESWGAMTRTGELGTQSPSIGAGPSDYWSLHDAVSEIAASHAEAAATTSSSLPVTSDGSVPPGTGSRANAVERTRARLSTNPGPSRPTPTQDPGPTRRTIRIVSPGSPAEAARLADALRRDEAILITLEGIDPALTRRIVDIASGIAYGLDASLTRVAHEVLLLRPQGKR